MPEYQKNHIPINDSHFGTKKEFSQPGVHARSGRAAETPKTHASRSISPRAVSFLLFWGIVAAALIIYWELSKADGVDHARTIGHETESAPSQKTPSTKNLTTSQRAKNHPTPQKINSSTGKEKSSVSTPKPQTVNTSGDWVGKWTSTGRYSGSWKMVKINEPIQSIPQDASLSQGKNPLAATERTGMGEKKKRATRRIIHSPSKGGNIKTLQKNARELARQGKWTEAAKLAAQVVDNAPGSLKDRRFLGLCLLSASQYQKGIEELEKVLKDGQTDVVVEHRLGHAYYKVESYDKALNAFKKAIALDPANPRHYKCGAQLIAAVLRLSPGFNSHLILAKTWYKKALALGMQPDGLAGVKRMFEKNDRTSVFIDDNAFSSAYSLG